MNAFRTMDSMPKDLDHGLLQELECPVCMECMQPPITMCENGHNICPNCKPKLSNCPSCTKPFLQVRNLALENLSRQVTDQKCQQQPVRVSQSVECPFTRISKDICSWKGTLLGMKDHVKNFHNNLNDTNEANGVFSVVLIGLSPAQHYRKAMFISDELFYIYWRIKDDSFYCAVLYVGDKEKCSKYKYKFTLTTESDDKKISMSFPTRCILEDLEELLQSGDCVVLKYNTVLKFMNTNMYLECEFQISSTEVDMGIAGGSCERNMSAASDVRSSLLGHVRRHPRIRRHVKDNLESSDKLVPIGKPGRCVHGKRFRHCRSCKYRTSLPNTQRSDGEFCTDSLENIQPPIGIYCEPSGRFVENESTEKRYVSSEVAPSAPTEKDLHSDSVRKFSSDLSAGEKACGEIYESSEQKCSAVTNSCSFPNKYTSSNPPPDLTWKCKLCKQTAPKFPDWSELGWHTSVSPTGSKWKCKMCGQLRQ